MCRLYGDCLWNTFPEKEALHFFIYSTFSKSERYYRKQRSDSVTFLHVSDVVLWDLRDKRTLGHWIYMSALRGIFLRNECDLNAQEKFVYLGFTSLLRRKLKLVSLKHSFLLLQVLPSEQLLPFEAKFTWNTPGSIAGLESRDKAALQRNFSGIVSVAVIFYEHLSFDYSVELNCGIYGIWQN